VTNLGTDLAGKQAADADLTAIAALNCAENEIMKRNGSGAWACAADGGGSAVVRILWSVTPVCQSPLAASGFNWVASSEPTATCEADNTSAYLSFGTSAKTVYFNFDLPSDWTSTASLHLTGWSTTPATNNPTIAVQHVCLAADATGTKTYATSQGVTIAMAASSGRTVATPLALDQTGCAAGKSYYAKLTITGNTTAFNLLRAWVTE
jgi:hypothetical protein